MTTTSRSLFLIFRKNGDTTSIISFNLKLTDKCKILLKLERLENFRFFGHRLSDY